MAAENRQQLDVAQLVREAHQRTRSYLTPAPLEFTRYMSDEIIGGLVKRQEHFEGKKVVAVVCRRNANLEVFKKIIT